MEPSTSLAVSDVQTSPFSRRTVETQLPSGCFFFDVPYPVFSARGAYLSRVAQPAPRMPLSLPDWGRREVKHTIRAAADRGLLSGEEHPLGPCEADEE